MQETWRSEITFRRRSSEVDRPVRCMEQDGNDLYLYERNFGGGYDMRILRGAATEVDPMSLIDGDYFDWFKVNNVGVRLRLMAKGVLRREDV